MTGCGRFGRFHVFFFELPWMGFDVEECACLLLIPGADEFTTVGAA